MSVIDGPVLKPSTPLDERPMTATAPSSSRTSNNNDVVSSSVMVAVRIRPLLALEAGSDRCLTVLHQTAAVIPCSLRLGGPTGPRFTFDHVYDCLSHQSAVFDNSCQPLVQSCLQGYNATVLAYGQTGSGKTYTMMGDAVAVNSEDAPMTAAAGVIPRALQHLFDALEQQKKQLQVADFQVRLQFLEVYGEEIRDLLSKVPTTSSSAYSYEDSKYYDASQSTKSDRLHIRDLGNNDEPEVVGATLHPVDNVQEAVQCLEAGRLRRVTGATAMNESSSRSHAILSVVVEQQQQQTTTSSDSTHVVVKRSKFNFVDLAGSERVKKTQAEGKRLKEGIDINKGLLVLGNVISALGDPRKKGKTFVPYRDSKLTRLLKGSLGGNHKTLMIACVSPSENNMDESLNCLRYANRAKNIQNNAVVNVDSASRLVTELQGQVQELAKALLRYIDGEPVDEAIFSRDTLQALAKGVPATFVGFPLSSPSNNWPATQIQAIPSGVNTERLQALELEISNMQQLLRQSQSNHDTAEEQLYVAKAEKELFQIQLSVLSDGKEGTQVESCQVEAAFVAKAVEYEKEIGNLRESLRAARAKLDGMAWISNDSSTQAGVALKKAQDELNMDRVRMNLLKSSLGGEEQDEEKDDDNLDEEDAVHELTRKYLADAGYDDSGVEDNAGKSRPEVHPKKQENAQVDLIELSRNIAAKEELIDQLRLSQDKYAVRT
jgi:hypothetical protein